MKAFPSTLCLCGILAALPVFAAPKHILLSDSLLANADKWNVKQGAQWFGKIHKWRFGDYAVVASKQGWTHTKTHTNLFKTKTESRTASKFSFVLSSQTTDSAFVDAAQEIMSKSNPGLKLGGGWTTGGDGLTRESDRFMASIMVNRDTTAAWDLFIGATDITDRHGDSVEGAGTHAVTLTSGERRIVVTPVFSKKFDKPPSFLSGIGMSFKPPAMGYEFVENGRSLCAVEYFSSGLAGFAKNTVWMDRNADPRLRLVLAAAMTAVLQLETAVASAPVEPDRE
jgi:hypothetical protein